MIRSSRRTPAAPLLAWGLGLAALGCNSNATVGSNDDGLGGGETTSAGATTSGDGDGDGDSTTTGTPTGTSSSGEGGGSASSGPGAGGGSSSSGGQGGGGEPVEVWFRSDFDTLDAAGSNLYDFANRFPQSGTTWETEHTEDQGYEGSPAPHVTIHGCDPASPTCNTSEHQFSAGWVSPALPIDPELGDRAFIRYRIKFDAGTTFPMEKFGAKFILFGTTGTTPNSRWIIHLMPPFENQGCTLGFDYSFMEWEPAAGTWTDYEDWGFGANFDSEPTLGLYASFQSSVNIGWSCNPAVLVTALDHPAPVPPPQSTGTAAAGGWTHLQFEAVSGPDGQSAFRTWANNNDEANPSTERVDMPEGLGVEGWADGVHVVGYWGTADMPPMGFIIDDFEIGPVFDPSWAD
jgi:hypothetical protein